MNETVIELDARGFEPPQPLMKTLEAVATLPDGAKLAMAEYWRWWVVHLWVEGFFEVFATVVIAFLFTRMGLLKTATAAS